MYVRRDGHVASSFPYVVCFESQVAGKLLAGMFVGLGVGSYAAVLSMGRQQTALVTGMRWWLKAVGDGAAI